MTVNNPTPDQLRFHQIAYYTMLLNESKSDDQKRFLRGQLYNLKKQNHDSVHPAGCVSGLFVFGSQNVKCLVEEINARLN